MSVKFGTIHDVHFHTFPAKLYRLMWGGEWRVYNTCAARFAEFVTTVNAANVNFNMQIGDLFDNGCTWATQLAAFKSEADNLTDKANDLYHVIGNHETNLIIDGADPFTDLAGYWGDDIENFYWDATDGANGQWWGYTFDRNGFRFIVCYTTGTGAIPAVHEIDNGGNDQLSWLEDDALNTALPVVVFAHGALTEPPMTVIKNSGLCQLVVIGHDHRETFTWDGDVPIFNGRGSIRSNIGPDDTSSNAYYIIEIDPNRIKGPNQWKGLVKITGYGWGTSFNADKFLFLGDGS